MTDINYGMNFAGQGGDAINAPVYSSLQSRLQVDLNNTAPLFNIITIPCGSAFSVNLLTTTVISEQLGTPIIHGLGYIPQVIAVFYLIPIGTPATPSNYAYSYSLGQSLLAQGGGGQDIINYSVNSQTLSFNHIVSSTSGGVGSYTSIAPSYKVQIKYLICNNPQIQTLSFN